MIEKISLILFGFVLTTVCGGLIGTLLQQIAWFNKWEIEKAQKQIDIAERIFEEISRLMDKRLYRIDQFSIWLKRQDAEKVQIALQSYREVLFDWNDNINRHLAMLQIYFGNDLRKEFDSGVGAKFVEAGAKIESVYRDFVSEGKSTADSVMADSLIRGLRSEVYEYNLQLLKRIEAKRNSWQWHTIFSAPDLLSRRNT